MTGIYMILCTPTKQVYIGQSKDIDARWVTHKRELSTGSHHSYKLQDAWDTYGSDAFEFAIVYECDEEFLNAMEAYYIEKYNSIDDGFNVVNINSLVRKKFRDNRERLSVNTKSIFISQSDVPWIDVELISRDIRFSMSLANMWKATIATDDYWPITGNNSELYAKLSDNKEFYFKAYSDISSDLKDKVVEAINHCLIVDCDTDIYQDTFYMNKDTVVHEGVTVSYVVISILSPKYFAKIPVVFSDDKINEQIKSIIERKIYEKEGME